MCEIGEFWQEASKAWKLKLYPHLLQALIKKRTFGSSEFSLEVKIESASSVPHNNNNRNGHFYDIRSLTKSKAQCALQKDAPKKVYKCIQMLNSQSKHITKHQSFRPHGHQTTQELFLLISK